MREWLKALAKWLDDPMTQAVVATLGASMILNGIVRAQVTADSAHARIDDLEKHTTRIVRAYS